MSESEQLMNWVLGLSVGVGAHGAAISLRPGEPGGAHLIGAFPTLTRAVSAAAAAAPDGPPSRVVLVHPAGFTAADLGHELGALGVAGLEVEDILLCGDVEVLSATVRDRVVLIDADRDLITGRLGRTERFNADRLAALVAEDPFGTVVALTGHPDLRDRYHLAARDFAPMMVERPALAALALDNPGGSALASTPRRVGTLTENGRRLSARLFLVLSAVLTAVILLGLMFAAGG